VGSKIVSNLEVLFMILIYEQQKMINELITRLAAEKIHFLKEW